ncbi:DUF4880 domain-containing protein [Pseudomonas sp. RIT-PI-AD]|uniref:FecR/PupR family sigma factor regulator n=1 Tax=Pseudomonas sp. RIT-PI-AD TaxID=3035294 RepID=UPI0021DB3554|nr:DUF4880 domain-containing protein [Pseudomonas sp. RIT-PI-AD]
MSEAPGPREPEDLASAWYVRLQSPELPASERIEFRRWLDADPRHSQAFSDVERLWQGLRQPARQLGASGWYRAPSRLAGMRRPLIGALLLALLMTLWSESARAPHGANPSSAHKVHSGQP